MEYNADTLVCQVHMNGGTHLAAFSQPFVLLSLSIHSLPTHTIITHSVISEDKLSEVYLKFPECKETHHASACMNLTMNAITYPVTLASY
jgi:hypothetical protein